MNCPLCGDSLQQKSLRNHLRFKHSQAEVSAIQGEEMEEEEAEGVFKCNMPNTPKARALCPIPGCGAHITRRYGMRRHFMFRHPMAAVHFPDEGPLIKCSVCGMEVPEKGHKGSQMCERAKQRGEKRRQVQANREAAGVEFVISGQPIETVTEFKYLGRVLASDDDDWPAVKANIHKARKRWGQVARILSREGATTSTMAYFYKAVVQAVLLYGSETWVLTQKMWKAIEGFHNCCARYIAGEHIRQRPNGEWILPSTAKVLDQCKLRTVREYIERRKEKIRVYMSSRPPTKPRQVPCP